MMEMIQNRLSSIAEELLVEEEASFRAGRSTAEQMFNSRILIDKHR